MSESAEYIIRVTHHVDGKINAVFEGVGDSDSDKEAIVYALHEIIKLVEFGYSVEIHKH
jgi:hypothetical protein